MKSVKDSVCAVVYRDLKRIAEESYLDKISHQNIMITGGGGFIAYYITLALLALNDEKGKNNTVFLLVRNQKRAEDKYGEILSRSDVKLLVQDVCTPFSFEGLTFGYIIHAASSADAKHFDDDPIGVFNSNVIGTENVIDFCRKNQTCKAIAYISSFTVYGAVDPAVESITEDYCGAEDWKTNRSCYSQGKRSAEFLCLSAFRKYGLPIRIIRPGFVYGASSPEDNRVYAEIIRNVALQKPIVLQSSGLVYRSMIYVTDLIRGILRVLFCGKDGEAYNIANEHVSIRQFAEGAVAAAKSSAVYLSFKTESDRAILPPVNVKGNMSNEKLKNECGWTPEVSILEGIAMAAEIYNYEYPTV